jgi:hypothetical protein
MIGVAEMLRVTERELRDRRDEVWGTVREGYLVAVTRDGFPGVILTRTSFMATAWVEWDDYMEGRGEGKDVYRRVADDGQRIAATHRDGVIFVVPIGIMAPVGETPAGIVKWVDHYEDDWVVGPTFVSIDEAEAGVVGLRL